METNAHFYTGAFHAGKLAAELRTLPALGPVVGADGLMHMVYGVTVNARGCILELPVDIDLAAVEQILTAHDPTPPPEPVPIDPDAELAAAISSSTSLDALKAALLGKGRLARAAGKKV